MQAAVFARNSESGLMSSSTRGLFIPAWLHGMPNLILEIVRFLSPRYKEGRAEYVEWLEQRDLE